MPNINLIHEQRAAVRRRIRNARLGLYVSAGSLGLTTVVSALLLVQTQLSKSEEDRLQAELKRLKPLSRQIDLCNEESSRLSPRVKTLADARKSTDRWQRILTHFTRNTPPNIWFTNVRSLCDDITKPVSVTVNGAGMAQAPIGELLLRTQNCADLENISLHYTEERTTQDRKAIQFEFVADVTGTAPPPPPVVPVEAPKS